MELQRKPTAKKTYSPDMFKKKFTGGKLNIKELQWIKLSEAFQHESGMPGIPMGYTTLFRGYSNTGKSTGLIEGIVSAQKMGQFIIIIDTETNLGPIHLKAMGFDIDSTNYLYVTPKFLLENITYNDPKKKDAEVPSIEDLAKFINEIIRSVEKGDIQSDVFIALDSIGTLDCDQTITALSGEASMNNQYNAGALERRFKAILNDRIPSTRSMDFPYIVTMAAVQKIYYDGMNNVVRHRGGEAFFSGSRLIYNHGGILTHGTKRIIATSKGRDVSFGIEAKINIAKNQIDSFVGGISFEGKLISTPHGFIKSDKDSIAEYKKKYMLFFRDQLGIGEDEEIELKETEVKEREED